MIKWREDSLVQDIHRMTNAFERIASAVDKPDNHKVEEIVRCEDCKNWNPQFKTANGNWLGSCDFHDVALVTSKGFCYWAERKEDDQRRSD